MDYNKFNSSVNEDTHTANNKSNSGLIIFLRISVVLVILAIIGLAAVVFVNIMNRKKLQDQVALEEASLEEMSELPTEEPVTEAETVTDAEAEENSDTEKINSKIPKDSWMYDKVLHSFHKTDKTISLPSADLEVFKQPAEESGEKTKAEDAVAQGPWDKVSLALDSVEGSINLSTPGEASKTEQLTSTYMVLVDLDTDEIVAERDCDLVVSPASMTKVLTVLTAREFISVNSLDDKFTITAEITDYVDRNDASAVGFRPGDEVTVRDLLYGTILPSGADAALGLAEYCCGSQEAFVEKMNQKVDELGLAETAHFTNVVGMYDKDLHCTMKDMAVILSMAVQDDLLRDVLSRRVYNTDIKYGVDENGEPLKKEDESEDEGSEEGAEEASEEVEEPYFPDGIEISNWFIRRIEDKEMDGKVVCAKTGYVSESGCCACSYYEAYNGKRYICVTGNSFSSWRTIYDHLSIYRSYTD